MKIAPVCLKDVAAACLARTAGPFYAKAETLIRRVLIDSRSFSGEPEGCLFVAMKTPTGDGHRFIRELYDKGVRFFLTSNPPDETLMPEAVFLTVDDTLRSLQAWASVHRDAFTIPIVGITGSNGKTWVKEWLQALLSTDFRVVSNPKSFNSQIGVPLSLLQIDRPHQIGIFEAGISRCGEMEALNRMIRPTSGIFTNIGTAHDAHFESREQKIREKLKLFEGVKTLVYCSDYKDIKEAVETDPSMGGVRLLSWSALPGGEADLRVIGRTALENGTAIEAIYKGETLRLFIPFLDRISFENAMHCWLFLLGAGFYDQSGIEARFKRLAPIEMRMEMQEGVMNSFVVNDVYNSDFNSFSLALDFLCSHHHNRRKCVVLSDIPQSGLSGERLYADVAEALKSRGIEDFTGIGEELCRHRALFPDTALFYPDTQAFIAAFNPADYAGKAVLLKGARAYAFERISRLLRKRVHETVMEVNLSALVHNLKFFRSLMKPETKLMVMGKAFSYGSGSHEIADILAFNRVDYITVAYPDEAVALRDKGIRLPIMCMNPEGEGMETLLKYNVEPVIYNYRVLDTLQAYLNHIGETRPDSIKIHIKFDTGMHRMGFEEPDLDLLTARLKQDPRLHVESVFTHLATADMPEMERYTLGQLERYDRMSGRFVAAFPYKVMRHCLNTAGIFRYPRYQYDMVRLGIGLYGVGTDADMQAQLETVSTLKTSISSIRRIPSGDAVGYGRRFIAARETVVGVIGIGYADGLNRHLGNGRGRVYVNGCYAPIIGSICMDMCMIDLTGIEARERDEVVVFGRELPVTEVADILGTIPYEVLTGISPRVPRVYFQE